jgi:hypothetical protein
MVKLSTKEINQFVKASYDKTLNKQNEKIGDYYLDNDLSTRKAKVYYDPKHDKVIVANRGTTSTASDWFNNYKYITGSYDKTDRMKQAKKVQKEAIDKYGRVDVNIGHSQGAVITRKLNDLGLTNEVINVNPAITTERQKKNEHNIRSSRDIVSMPSLLNPFMKNKKNLTIKADTFNPLTEHSADILERIPEQMIGRGVFSDNEPLKKRVFLKATFSEKSKTFSDNELTDTEIKELMKGLKLPLNGIYIDDKMPKRLKNGNYVINLNGRSHWCGLVRDGKKYFYFDSYGFVPSQEVEDQIGKYVYSDFDVQSIDSSSCGFYVIAFFKALNKKKDKMKAYHSFLKKFGSNKFKNESVMEKILKSN